MPMAYKTLRALLVALLTDNSPVCNAMTVPGSAVQLVKAGFLLEQHDLRCTARLDRYGRIGASKLRGRRALKHS